MAKFIVNVLSTVEVELDETKFTDAFMAEFRKDFYHFPDIINHAEHIGQLAAREVHFFGSDRTEFVEGYGPIGDFGIKARVKSVEAEGARV